MKKYVVVLVFVSLFMIASMCVFAAPVTDCNGKPDGTDCKDGSNVDGCYGYICQSGDVYCNYRDYGCKNDDCEYTTSQQFVENCDDGKPWTVDSCQGGVCKHDVVTEPYSFNAPGSACSGSFFGISMAKSKSWIPDTVFEYSLSGTTVRANCPSDGDPEWLGDCWASTNVPVGTYALQVSYSVWGQNYFKTIDNSFDITSTCSVCAQCQHGFGNTTPGSIVSYAKDFTGPYVIDGADYIVCPSCVMSVSGINSYNYRCGNGVPFSGVNNLVSWTYNASNYARKLAKTENRIAITPSVERGAIIGDPAGSSTCGTVVTNVADTPIYLIGGSSSMGVYTFNQRSNYTVFIDAILGYCDSPTYVCPWLGSTMPRRSNICEYGVLGNPEGWMPFENVSVIIPDPNISISKPSDEFDPKTIWVNKTWVVNNTGLGKANITISDDCGGWKCTFPAYSNGSQIRLNEKGRTQSSYVVDMNIMIDQSELYPHEIGIRITYDDGYGLPCIAPKNYSSYINVTIPHTL